MNELRVALEEYLNLRRSLGFKLDEVGRLLHHFVAYAEKEGASFVTTELALRWATRQKTCLPSHWATQLCAVRAFAQCLSTRDLRTEIPPHGLLPHRVHRTKPYIYTDEEIVRLIKAARQLPSPRGLRALTYSTLFGLLAVTGMRVSEPVRLDRDDVELTRGILTVRQAKFGKSRMLPVHTSTLEALRHYRHHRDRVCPWARTRSFFISEAGTRLTTWSVRQTFVRLSRQTGLRGPEESHGPRLHDLRHGFAIQTLLAWYRHGINVEQHLPELSAYLGHVHVHDTYWYISAVPELLQLATLRLEQGGKMR
jgi:integrase/recombinase XerD